MLKLIIWLSTLNHTPYSFLKCSIFTKVLVILISRHNYLRQFPDFERKKISDKDEGGGGGGIELTCLPLTKMFGPRFVPCDKFVIYIFFHYKLLTMHKVGWEDRRWIMDTEIRR